MHLPFAPNIQRVALYPEHLCKGEKARPSPNTQLLHGCTVGEEHSRFPYVERL